MFTSLFGDPAPIPEPDWQRCCLLWRRPVCNKCGVKFRKLSDWQYHWICWHMPIEIRVNA